MLFRRPAIIGIVLLLFVSWGVIDYHPPLIGKGGFNPPARLYDMVAFGWYYSRAAWEGSRDGLAPVPAALAAWHRSGMAKRLLGVSTHDRITLARKYLSRGLRKEGMALLEGVRGSPEEFSLALALLGVLAEWKKVDKLAQEPVPACRPSSTRRRTMNRLTRK